MATEERDVINISGRALAVMIVLALLLIGSFSVIALKKLDTSVFSANAGINRLNEDIPEKCRLPDGQDAISWKEHLGHHSETQECLQYFP